MRKFLFACAAFLALFAALPARAEGTAVKVYVGASTVTGSANAASTTQGLIENDVSGYASATVQFTSVGSGNTVTLEGSNDNSAWVTLPGFTLAGASHTGAVSPSTSVANVVPLTTRYFRARLSTYSSGTVSASVTYKAVAADPSVSGAPVVVQGGVASGATDSGNPLKVGGVFASTPAAVTDGQRRDASIDNRGQLRVAISDYNHAQAGNVGAVVSTSNGDANSGGLGHLYVKNYAQSFNGSTWDREFTCPSSAVVNVAAAATTQIVALSGSTVIRVCSFVISADTAATTATFVYGTGANCGTGTTSLTGAMRLQDEGNISLSGMNGSLFRGAAANALCLTAATGAVTGFVTYARY